ncbi:MAG: hypothetical protein EPN51_14395 [Mycobacterium sp.]|nr:MAG: hypothetical protein EPN51_14395 [Mycobacterium sp.]
MEMKVQRVLLYGGLGMIVVWLGAFVLVAGFIPPSAPSASPEALVRLYEDHAIAIKVGLVLAMFGSALLVPFACAVSGQLRRIDGARMLADVQMVSCALLSLEFISPIAMWLGVSFRVDERPAPITETIHDVSWIVFMTVIWSLFVQLIAIAVAIFIDRNSEPVLPRWLGYLNLWVAMLILPAGTVTFFKSGPFAWNGVMGIYVPIGAFAVWFSAMTYVIHKNLNRQIAALTPDSATG